MKCIGCGGYSFTNSRCNYCGSTAPSDPTVAEKKPLTDLPEWIRRSKIPKRSICIQCGRQSLFYDMDSDEFSCLKIDCYYHTHNILPNTTTYYEVIVLISKTNNDNDDAGITQNISKSIKDPFKNIVWPGQTISPIEKSKSVFLNPSLLSAKMLLADKQSWTKKYKDFEYVCSDFTKDVFDSMTLREIRCGFVTINFDKGPGHAIVAFETDYGLVYFEPQSGNQVEPRIGNSGDVVSELYY